MSRFLDVASYVLTLALVVSLVAFLRGAPYSVYIAEGLAYLGILLGILQVFSQRPVVASMLLLVSSIVLLSIAAIIYRETGSVNPVLVGSGGIALAISMYTMYSYATRSRRCVEAETDFV